MSLLTKGFSTTLQFSSNTTNTLLENLMSCSMKMLNTTYLLLTKLNQYMKIVSFFIKNHIEKHVNGAKNCTLQLLNNICSIFNVFNIKKVGCNFLHH